MEWNSLQRGREKLCFVMEMLYNLHDLDNYYALILHEFR